VTTARRMAAASQPAGALAPGNTRRLASCSCWVACCSLGADTRCACTAPLAATATTSNTDAPPAVIARLRPPARSTT
jgi:hypothetical protein